MSDLHLCIHGHFYQPPRENPWWGIIEAQPSAQPYHDWNERIAAECYAPNGWARVLGPEGRIAKIINNYEYISFNVGPTLLSWLQRADPRAYRRILDADRNSLLNYQGHGNAMAQVYNHLIMPLANTRDKSTQIRWGLADFAHRFGRPAEGMWLAEAAVDTESLRLMAQAGVRFTVLSPEQAQAIRPLRPGGTAGPKETGKTAVPASMAWQDVSGGHIDPRRPYRVLLPGGLWIDVFFYDGPTSRAVAYERLLTHGPGFMARIRQAAGAETGWPRLISLATDGESYGHHFPFGDMALAWLFDQLHDGQTLTPINYGLFLELHPPEFEVRLLENSSWSCAHGVERWRADCGCHVGGQPGWTQQWRAPLREGLDWLRDHLATIFEGEGSRLFKDPWTARDAYIAVLLEPGAESRATFLAAQTRRTLNPTEQVQALTLLESQLMAMFMFTSCGWFFDDIAGLEPVQDLRYAARAMDLVRPWAKRDLEAGLLAFLSRAKCNDPEYENGADVFRRLVLAARLSPDQVAAHYGLHRLGTGVGPPAGPLANLVRPVRQRQIMGPGLEVLVGEVKVRDERTGYEVPRVFSAIYRGGTDLTVLVAETDDFDYPGVARAMSPAVNAAAPAEVDTIFRGARPKAVRYVLDDLRPDVRGLIIHSLAERLLADCQDQVREVGELQAEIISLLLTTGQPVPDMAHFVLRLVLGGRLTLLLEGAMADPEADLTPLLALGRQSKTLGLKLDSPALTDKAKTLLSRALENITWGPDPVGMERFLKLLYLVRDLNLDLHRETWDYQNAYDELRQDPAYGRAMTAEARAGFQVLGRELGFFIAPEKKND